LFITLGLSAAAFIILWREWAAILQQWEPLHWLMLVQFAAIPALLTVAVLGTALANPAAHQEPHKWASRSSEIIWWSSLLFGFACIWRMKGLRTLATVAVLWCQWIMLAVVVSAATAP
jgi:hypothetical protein